MYIHSKLYRGEISFTIKVKHYNVFISTIMVQLGAVPYFFYLMHNFMIKWQNNLNMKTLQIHVSVL